MNYFPHLIFIILLIGKSYAYIKFEIDNNATFNECSLVTCFFCFQCDPLYRIVNWICAWNCGCICPKSI